MQFDEPLDEREPDAETTVRQLPGLIHLGEHVEHPIEHLDRDASAGVRDRCLQAITGITPHQGAAQLDRAAGRGVFRGVVQEIGQNLGQAYGVGLDYQIAPVEQRPSGCDGWRR